MSPPVESFAPFFFAMCNHRAILEIAHQISMMGKQTGIG